MKLNHETLKNRTEWEQKGYRLPEYDRKAMIEKTKAEPTWLHFGSGNIFKALHGMAAERLLNEGILDRGIIAVERRDNGGEKNDDLAVVVTLKANGTIEKNILGAVAETCYLYGGEERLTEIFTSPSLQLATFTITEKGYSLNGDDVKADLSASPAEVTSYMGKVASLLLERYRAGAYPIAMVSTDNCSHNGDKLKAAMCAFAEAWCDEGFMSYITDEKKVSFPWTMIDKITPSPDLNVGAMLETDGLEGFKPVRNARGTVKALDDRGEPFEPSPDPLLETAQQYVSDMKLGEKPDCAKLEGLLRNETIFGLDLMEAGLAEKVCSYFTELTAGTGAVRATLHRAVAES